MNADLITVYFDGACAPKNPGGHMGFGCYIIEGNKVVYEYGGYVPQSPANSNNVAEYIALENCLDWLFDNGYQDDPIKVFGDSMLVINQMKNYWRIKHGRYLPTALRCKEKKTNFTNIRFKWIRREYNYLADQLSNKVFIKKGIKPFQKPLTFI